ncbi:MAG: molybdate ABC transporter substrate-binding protein [Rhodospirillales bacterium]|nr:molybdate ABC transporter substrate-binding protein [Rhodospirillales bacterium]
MWRALLSIAALGAGIWSAPAKADRILVFAAASLKPPLEVIARRFNKLSPDQVRISFAASSALARQIAGGAPADMFLSANQHWMDWLAGQGSIAGPSRAILLRNRLVLAASAPAKAVTGPLTPEILAGIIGGGRLALADPAHVPAGIYAKQALQSLGLWNVAASRLAPQANVRTALALIERKEVPAGLVYASDVYKNPRVRAIYEFSGKSHDPIQYAAALTSLAPTPGAKIFYELLFSASSKKTYKKFGFLTD